MRNRDSTAKDDKYGLHKENIDKPGKQTYSQLVDMA